MELTLTVEAGLKPIDALRTATINGLTDDAGTHDCAPEQLLALYERLREDYVNIRMRHDFVHAVVGAAEGENGEVYEEQH